CSPGMGAGTRSTARTRRTFSPRPSCSSGCRARPAAEPSRRGGSPVRAPHTPLLSFIVPSQGQMTDLWFSAPALLGDARGEYVLVDSGQANCPGNVARGYWPTARVLDLPGCHPVDRGAAVREGVRVASAPWMAILAPAAIVSERFLAEVLARRAEGIFLTAD